MRRLLALLALALAACTPGSQTQQSGTPVAIPDTSSAPAPAEPPAAVAAASR